MNTMAYHQRIADSMVDRLIANEGTTDGVRPPNTTGILRLALDLREARLEVRRLQGYLTCPVSGDEHAYDEAGGPDALCADCGAARYTTNH